MPPPLCVVWCCVLSLPLVVFRAPWSYIPIHTPLTIICVTNNSTSSYSLRPADLRQRTTAAWYNSLVILSSYIHLTPSLFTTWCVRPLVSNTRDVTANSGVLSFSYRGYDVEVPPHSPFLSSPRATLLALATLLGLFRLGLQAIAVSLVSTRHLSLPLCLCGLSHTNERRVFRAALR